MHMRSLEYMPGLPRCPSFRRSCIARSINISQVHLSTYTYKRILPNVQIRFTAWKVYTPTVVGINFCKNCTCSTYANIMSDVSGKKQTSQMTSSQVMHSSWAPLDYRTCILGLSSTKRFYTKKTIIRHIGGSSACFNYLVRYRCGWFPLLSKPLMATLSTCIITTVFASDYFHLIKLVLSKLIIYSAIDISLKILNLRFLVYSVEHCVRFCRSPQGRSEQN